MRISYPILLLLSFGKESATPIFELKISLSLNSIYQPLTMSSTPTLPRIFNNKYSIGKWLSKYDTITKSNIKTTDLNRKF